MSDQQTDITLKAWAKAREEKINETGNALIALSGLGEVVGNAGGGVVGYDGITPDQLTALGLADQILADRIGTGIYADLIEEI